MKKVIATALLVCFATFASRAQDFDSDSVYYSPIPKTDNGKNIKDKGGDVEIQPVKKVAYFFTIQSGALVGCKDCSFKREVSFSSATIHGVTIGKRFRVGAGIGFDTYQNWQTIPIFGSVSWDLFGDKNRNAVFLQFNYGFAKASTGASAYFYYPNVEGGRMISTQIGYRIKYHDLKISIGVGSKYQRVTASYEYPTYYYDLMGTPKTGSSNTSVMSESMNRLSLMMSVGWK